MALFVKKCPCLRPKIEEDVRVLDYRHCSLTDVPGEVFNFERTLEELYVDSNQIGDLPRELFYCHGLRKLSISDNEIKTIPSAIESLISLEHLDLSKNGIIDIPETIKTCKYLRIVDASVNPLGKLPDGFTQLLNLTQLYLNDTFLDYLPGNFGRLSRLKILELRENHLKTLPKSFSRLTELEKLDIGHNEFTELPDVVGSLSNLLELWCDHNQVATITPTIGNLKQLMFFDGSKNNIQSLPSEIEGCTSLADLHLTTNQLQSLPDSIGNLSNLTTLKADDNHLTALPNTIGGMTSLSELNVSANDLQALPPSLGLLRYLRTLYADENLLEYIPAELGSCSGITVLSLRGNKLTYIPDELGRIPRLRVLNLSSNKLECLPFTFIKLKELQALWLSENQTRPLIPLQSEFDPDTGRKLLTCYLLPQRPPQDSGAPDGDNDSFHESMWEEERRQRQIIHFEFGDDSDVDGHLIRQPTPYPKEMREKLRHVKNMQLRQAMSNGVDRRQGQDNMAYEQSPSAERSQIGPQPGSTELRRREARPNKPGSPSLHDPYSLYKYDKEKLARDKARIQQRRNSESGGEEEKSPRRFSLPVQSLTTGEKNRKGRDRKSREAEDDDGGFGERRVTSLGSTPDIPSNSNSHREIKNGLTYCSPSELSRSISQPSDHSRTLGSHRHGNKSQRQRKMRDYDSDTGYRSDHELVKFHQLQEQMFTRLEIPSKGENVSEIVPTYSRKGRRRDGYSSDLEGYSHRGIGVAYREVTDSEAKNGNNNTHGLPSALNSSSSHNHSNYNQSSHVNSPSQPSPRSQTVRNDQLYEPNVSNSTTRPVQYHSSPSPLHRSTVVDQSTPVTPKHYVAVDPSSVRSHDPSARRSHDASAVRSHDASAVRSHGKTDNVRQSQGNLDKQFEELGAASDQRDTDSPSDSLNRYMVNDSSQSSASKNKDRPALPPYKPAPAYSSSPGQRKLPPTPHRTSPYGVTNYNRQDRKDRSSPLKEYQNRNMPDIQEAAGRDSDLSRSRSRSVVDSACVLNSREQRRYDRRYSADVVSRGNYSEIHDGNLSGSEYGKGNYLEIAPESPRTPTSQSANNSKLSSAGAADITPTSSKDSGNYSYREHPSIMESPGSNLNYEDNQEYRKSPSVPTQRLQAEHSSHDSSFEYSNQIRNLNRYDGNFREPPTVDIPTKYDDIAIFKSAEALDQVSSSTDSGYGQGHINHFDRVSEVQRFSGASQGSPSPDQFNSESPATSSPHREVTGQCSRGATPVNHSDRGGKQYDREGNEEEIFTYPYSERLPERKPKLSDQADTNQAVQPQKKFRVTIIKNPGLGFSIAGGVGSYGNPFRPGDTGIFVTKVQDQGPAAVFLQPGDKVLEVNGIDFSQIAHNRAVELLKSTGNKVSLFVERDAS